MTEPQGQSMYRCWGSSPVTHPAPCRVARQAVRCQPHDIRTSAHALQSRKRKNCSKRGLIPWFPIESCYRCTSIPRRCCTSWTKPRWNTGVFAGAYREVDLQHPVLGDVNISAGDYRFRACAKGQLTEAPTTQGLLQLPVQAFLNAGLHLRPRSLL